MRQTAKCRALVCKYSVNVHKRANFQMMSIAKKKHALKYALDDVVCFELFQLALPLLSLIDTPAPVLQLTRLSLV